MGIFCPLIFKKLKGKHKIILGFIDNYLVALQAKYASKVTVKWVWAVCALVSVIAVIGLRLIVRHNQGILLAESS